MNNEMIDRVVREAAEPWADYHGDIPDYDHPLRPVYESGIQYAVELLAKMLEVEDWEICDGTEEFDGDLGGTLLNIVIKTWPTDEHGDWLDLRDPETRDALASRDPEAANDARELAANIMAAMRRAKFPKDYADEAHDEFEALVLVPMLHAALGAANTPEQQTQRSGGD